jgi:hypothetical protein
MEKREFEILIGKLRETYGDKTYNDYRTEEFWRQLQHVPFFLMEETVQELLATAQRPPLLQQIREVLQSKSNKYAAEKQAEIEHKIEKIKKCQWCDKNGLLEGFNIKADPYKPQSKTFRCDFCEVASLRSLFNFSPVSSFNIHKISKDYVLDVADLETLKKFSADNLNRYRELMDQLVSSRCKNGYERWESFLLALEKGDFQKWIQGYEIEKEKNYVPKVKFGDFDKLLEYARFSYRDMKKQAEGWSQDEELQQAYRNGEKMSKEFYEDQKLVMQKQSEV